ncbi:hypothetical protein JCM19232_1517 [Vibrio ishigakensis]|uniref:Uncharacterized protein n=1 Tax=Vibrio ishigakensis TaxID=1481914 RepID=A0A0B8P990_9VIBR|nr:hypothetical protein JCM19232_1517 [Vibrio ishigakensis]
MKTSAKITVEGAIDETTEQESSCEQKALFINAYSASEQAVVYVLASNDQTFLHVSSTTNLQETIWNQKLEVQKSLGLVFLVQNLVYYEAAQDISTARERAKEILGWPERNIRGLVESVNPKWDDLFNYF